MALGLGAILAPLCVELPRSFLLGAAAPVLVGLTVVGEITARLAGVVLLLAFSAAMAYLVLASRLRPLQMSKEVEEAGEDRLGTVVVVGLTLLGSVGVGVGGEFVTQGAQRLVGYLGIPAFLMGMVVAPAVIELEEVIRQDVPAKEGHPEVRAGNLVGTLLYFTLCNLGLIALVAPGSVPSLVRALDWPFLVGATWLALLFLWRGRVGCLEETVLLLVYVAYLVLHIVIR